MRRAILGVLKRFKRVLPEDTFLRIFHEYYMGRPLDLDDPREFTEKIQWLKLYFRDPRLPRLVDKYAVRAYVEEKVGARYLNELYAVWDRAADVTFEGLPDRFVLKAVHGCHFNILVDDRNDFSPARARRRLRRWSRKNQYWRGGLEWAYRDVPPRIIAEAFLEQPGSSVLTDYKFFCFGGEPRFVQVDLERGIDDLRAYYDMSWSRQPFTTAGRANPLEGEAERPENFEEMVEVARSLADDLPFVRVDLYNLDGRIVFGEMTFYPGDGRRPFAPDEYNRRIGDLIELPARTG